MCPTMREDERCVLAAIVAHPLVGGIVVDLQDSGESLKDRPGMLGAAVGRVVVDDRGWRL